MDADTVLFIFLLLLGAVVGGVIGWQFSPAWAFGGVIIGGLAGGASGAFLAGR